MPESTLKQVMPKNHKFVDMTGFENNGIKVLEFAFVKLNRSFWKCRCRCGEVFICLGKHIKNGNTKSCGCLQPATASKLMKLPRGESAFNRAYHSYIVSARERSLEFKISKHDFKIITQKDCFYCGNKPTRVSYIKNGNGVYIYNGIDRIDNSIGYIDSNIVPCCTNCNTMKMRLSLDDFFSVVKRIYERHIKDA